MTPLIAALKRIPADIWYGLFGIAVIIGLWFGVLHYGQRKYDDGYAFAMTKATIVLRVDTVDRVVARTDTVIKRVTQRIATTDTLIALVHDTIRIRFPEVDAALKACTALSQDCETLRASVLTERTVWAARDTALRLRIVAKDDTVRTLGKRWTRTATVLSAMLAAGTGFFVGRR